MEHPRRCSRCSRRCGQQPRQHIHLAARSAMAPEPRHHDGRCMCRCAPVLLNAICAAFATHQHTVSRCCFVPCSHVSHGCCSLSQQRPQRLRLLLQPLQLMRCFAVPTGWNGSDAAAAYCQLEVTLAKLAIVWAERNPSCCHATPACHSCVGAKSRCWWQACLARSSSVACLLTFKFPHDKHRHT